MIERPPYYTRTGRFLLAVVCGMILAVVMYRFLSRWVA